MSFIGKEFRATKLACCGAAGLLASCAVTPSATLNLSDLNAQNPALQDVKVNVFIPDLYLDPHKCVIMEASNLGPKGTLVRVHSVPQPLPGASPESCFSDVPKNIQMTPAEATAFAASVNQAPAKVEIPGPAGQKFVKGVDGNLYLLDFERITVQPDEKGYPISKCDASCNKEPKTISVRKPPVKVELTTVNNTPVITFVNPPLPVDQIQTYRFPSDFVADAAAIAGLIEGVGAGFGDAVIPFKLPSENTNNTTNVNASNQGVQATGTGGAGGTATNSNKIKTSATGGSTGPVSATGGSTGPVSATGGSTGPVSATGGSTGPVSATGTGGQAAATGGSTGPVSNTDSSSSSSSARQQQDQSQQQQQQQKQTSVNNNRNNNENSNDNHNNANADRDSSSTSTAPTPPCNSCNKGSGSGHSWGTGGMGGGWAPGSMSGGPTN